MHSRRGTSACYVIHIQGNVSKVQPPSTHHVILSNRKCACLLQESQTSETLHCIGWGGRGVPDGVVCGVVQAAYQVLVRASAR